MGAKILATFLLDIRAKLVTSRDWTIAFLMLMAYVVMITVSSQLTSLVFTQSANFHAPFLFILFKMLFRTLAFPIYLVINFLVRFCKHKTTNLPQLWRHCKSICGPDGLTWRILVFKFFPTALTMLLMQIGYTIGLTYLSTSMTTALYCAAVAISYGLTFVFFKRPLLLIKSIFVLVSFAGVGLIAYGNFTVKNDLSKTVMGIVASLLSALFLSLHQICFMKAFPMSYLGQVSFAVSGMNFLICLMYWPVPLILYVIKYEVYNFSDMPSGLVIASWICTGISSTTAGYGLVLSSPFFMSIGELLILAANSIIDVNFRHLVMPLTQFIGIVFIGAAFLVLVIPDSVLSINCTPDSDDVEDETVVEEPTIFTVESPDRSKSVVSFPANFEARKTSTHGKGSRNSWKSLAHSRRSSAHSDRRTSVFSASGELVNKFGQRTSYEFYPSSEPSIILSNRRGSIPVVLPIARINLKRSEIVRRISVWNNGHIDEDQEEEVPSVIWREKARSMSIFQ